MKPVKLLLGVALIAWAGTAQALPIFTNADVSIYQGSATFPSGLSEQDIFLVTSPSGGVNTGFGTIGFNGTCGSGGPAPCVNFTSSALIDLANGGGTIKPAGDTFHDLTITVPGYKFGDFIFDVQLQNTKENPLGLDLTISAYYGASLLGSISLTDPAIDHDALMSFLVLNGDSAMTKIVLESNSGFEGLFGFKETKHFQISGLALDVGPNPETFPSTPIPGAVWLFGTVLAGGAGFSRWRKRKQTAKAAA